MNVLATRFKFLSASGLLFLVSLALPALQFTTTSGRDTMPGLAVLIFGGFDVFDGVVGWLANPLLALAWLMLALRKRVPAALLSVASLGFAISSVQLFTTGVMKDEGGARHPLEAFGSGYYLWCAAIAATLVGALVSKEKPAVTT